MQGRFYLLLGKPLEEQMLRPLKMLNFPVSQLKAASQNLVAKRLFWEAGKLKLDETLMQPAMEQVYLAAGKTYARRTNNKPTPITARTDRE